MRAQKKSQLFNLENFDKIPEYRKKQGELEKKREEILNALSKNVDEIEHFFTNENPQLEHIEVNSDVADIIKDELQCLPYYAYTDELGWAINKEAGWIYEHSTEDLTRIPYNKKVVDLLETFDDLSQQLTEIENTLESSELPNTEK